MRPRAIVGIIFLGIAAGLLLTSLYYSHLGSMRYLNYLCPTISDCININNTYLNLARVFGISGGIIGGIGAWLTVTGLKLKGMQKTNQ